MGNSLVEAVTQGTRGKVQTEVSDATWGTPGSKGVGATPASALTAAFAAMSCCKSGDAWAPAASCPPSACVSRRPFGLRLGSASIFQAA